MPHSSPFLLVLGLCFALSACDDEAVLVESSYGETFWGQGLCPEIPDRLSTEPPGPDTGGTRCRFMDWDLSPDGFYIISQFGTTEDPTTMGRGTSCSALQTHYAAQCCLYDIELGECLDEDASGEQKVRKYQAERGDAPNECHIEDIPETGPPEILDATRLSNGWYRGRRIDFDFWRLVSQIKNYYFIDPLQPGEGVKPKEESNEFDHREYFYVAGAQRFGCGAYLRVTNPANNRCIVVYADDGGPGSGWEGKGFAGRRILDASPAVNTYLGSKGIGPRNGDMMFVEWAMPGDRPGDPCTPCESTPAMLGTEVLRSPFDLAHGFTGAADCRSDDIKQSFGVHGGTEVHYTDTL